MVAHQPRERGRDSVPEGEAHPERSVGGSGSDGTDETRSHYYAASGPGRPDPPQWESSNRLLFLYQD
jgi:hypothetical protein